MVDMLLLNFTELLEELKKPETILIDVRSAEELKHDGKIPASKNLHIADLKIAMKMTDEEFEKRYKFPKPSKGDHIICHCKGGMRGQRFAGMLQEEGFTDVSVYPGLVDYVSNGGDIIPGVPSV